MTRCWVPSRSISADSPYTLSVPVSGFAAELGTLFYDGTRRCSRCPYDCSQAFRVVLKLARKPTRTELRLGLLETGESYPTPEVNY